MTTPFIPDAPPATTTYTGDILQGVPVITRLCCSDLPAGQNYRFYFQGVEMGNRPALVCAPDWLPRGHGPVRPLPWWPECHGDELSFYKNGCSGSWQNCTPAPCLPLGHSRVGLSRAELGSLISVGPPGLVPWAYGRGGLEGLARLCGTPYRPGLARRRTPYLATNPRPSGAG